MLHINHKYNIYFALLLLFAKCNSTTGQDTKHYFIDQASSLGIIHEYSGAGAGGISFIDFNQDGLDDITLAGSKGQTISFYKNTGGSFEKLPPIIPYTDEVKQVIWVDYDNDGDLDLYYCTYDSMNRLFRNDGFPIFYDVTLESGLPIYANRSHGALWSDINRDGWLDLYFTNRKIPTYHPDNKNSLFLNNGDGTFLDVSDISGTEDPGKLPFCATAFDYNGDKWPDFYVSNDRAGGNAFFKNNADSTFTEISHETDTYFEIDAMTVTVGDINNDEQLDFYLTNLPEEGNKLLVNQGHSITDSLVTFSEESALRGADFHFFSWGANFLDVNLDGWLDLYISSSDPESNGKRLLMNTGNGFFEQRSYGFPGDSLISYSNAVGDINNDGRYEIIQMNNNDPLQLWQDTVNITNHWISIQLTGIHSNRNGVGSQIKVYTGDQVQMKFTTCGTAFLGQNSLTHIFGVSNKNTVDSIHIQWPTGHVDKLYDLKTDEKYNIKEGQTNNNVILIDEEILHLYSIPKTTIFEEAQATAGIDHVHRHQQFLGGGAAIFDYDNDGDLDIYLTGGVDMDKLYANDGLGTFTDVSFEAGLFITSLYYTNGVIHGDVDNDGLKDIFVTTTGNVQQQFSKNLLFHNQGDGTFIEKWTPNNFHDNTAALGATFIDFDQDGLLDIYVVSYVKESGFLRDENNEIIGFDHDCFENRIYRNMGVPEKFIDYTDSLNIYDSGCSLATAASDVNLDGYQDLLTANDFGEWINPNTLHQYDTLSSHFIDQGAEKGFDFKMYGMGIAISDIDHDLDLDYYITNIGKNILLQNHLDSFQNIAAVSKVENEWVVEDSIAAVSWGASFFDYNNDSYEDLYIANGYVPTPDFLTTGIKDHDVFYENQGDLTFVEIDSIQSGINNAYSTRGTASGDIDSDGDIDLIAAVISVPQNENTWNTKLYMNESTNDNNWVQFDLEGIIANRDAYGSQIKLFAEEITLLKELNGGSSHCSHDSDIIHFGLGQAEKIDSIEIKWPSSSKIQKVYDIEINNKHHVLEDTVGTNISVDTTTSIQEVVIEELVIFPNPAQGHQIQLRSNSPIKIESIWRLDGSLCPFEYIQDGNKYYVHLKPNGTLSGVYLISYYIKGILKTKRIIVQSSP